MKAQRPPEFLYEITFGEPITVYQEKFVQEGLRSQDPDPVVVVAHEEKKVWVGTSAILDQALLNNALLPSGLYITSFNPIDESGYPIGMNANGLNDQMPEYVSTGNVPRDNTIYDLKKRVWLARRKMMPGSK